MKKYYLLAAVAILCWSSVATFVKLLIIVIGILMQSRAKTR